MRALVAFVNSKKLSFVGILSVFLLSGFITTCFVSYYVARDSISSQIAETTLPLTSDNIYSEIQRDLLRPIFISSLMAHDTFLRDWVITGEQDEKAIIRYLDEIQKKYGTVSSFFISEKTRKYYHPKGILKKVSETDPNDKWYFRVQKMHNDYEINIDPDTADRSSLTIFINYRVYDYENNYIGVTGVGLAVKAVSKMINNYQKRYSRRIYFTDKEGIITLRSADFSGIEDIRQIPGLSVYALQLLTSPSNSITYNDNGKIVYLNSRFVSEFRWYLFVEQVEDPAKSRLLKTLLGNLALSLVITLIVLFVVYMTMGKYQNKLEEMATTDKLTGLSNRHMFDALFNQAVKEAKRRGIRLSAILFDIDFFKNVNDTYGHLGGDLVLKGVTDIARNQIRDSDMFFRWGGEEFLILLNDCNLEQASKVAEKIRYAVENQKNLTIFGQTVAVTASFGVAELWENESEDGLIRRIDNALYAAKDSGRNRVEMAS